MIGRLRIVEWEDMPPCNSCAKLSPTILSFDRDDGGDSVDISLCDECLGRLKLEVCGGTITPGVRGGGKVGRRHPDQSKRAAANVHAGTQHYHLLKVLRHAGMDGITCFDAAPKLSGWCASTISANQTATRMGELAERGLVEPVERDGRPLLRTTTPGNEGQVWRITIAGRNELSRLDVGTVRA